MEFCKLAAVGVMALRSDTRPHLRRHL